MKPEEIIQMAREAGFNHPRLETETDYSRLERFAELVRADEHASMMQLFTDPENQPTQHGTVTVEYMREYMQREIAAEREACAALCDARAIECDGFTEEQHASEKLAEDIRARGQA